MESMNKAVYKVNLSDAFKLLVHDDAVFCSGDLFYYHYGCDGVDDRGWGCGYRTLQTLCSWVESLNKVATGTTSPTSVPSINQIQTALVDIGDKPSNFRHSKQWIGSVEICLCLDVFYDIPCKIIHIEKGSQFKQYCSEIFHHFVNVGAPIMMGGETDNSSKGIIGVRLKNPALLIADPHYFGTVNSAKHLLELGFIHWLPVSELHEDSFYNLCLPQARTPVKSNKS
ncbi:ufm1-specific protease 1-like isoform X1 [Biomphalaria glabrata]|uniref:Ufm1-specific protease 1-like isoform X1 n=1 Tax=Biomphalaria glabrata TaxID=6526 RepID=A0A9U8E502_BIOGL|nr:ufm1-specific protease 1-like isoform X1 [Biomphalaria glabrata]